MWGMEQMPAAPAHTLNYHFFLLDNQIYKEKLFFLSYACFKLYARPNFTQFRVYYQNAI